MQWKSYSEYIDIETGEIVPVYDKKRFEREYRIINKDKKTKIEDEKGIIKYTNFVRRIEQQGELFGENTTEMGSRGNAVYDSAITRRISNSNGKTLSGKNRK